MIDHVPNALRRLAAVYGDPQTEFKGELIAEFKAALAPYRADILTKAIDRVIRERAFPTWPTVGEVVKACREVSDEMADRNFSQPSPVYDKPPVSQEQAAKLMGYARHFMDPRRAYPALMDSARAWARHHGCKVTVDVDQDPPMWDEHGRTIPFGWKIGDAA